MIDLTVPELPPPTFQTAGIREVLLPSGHRVRLRLPTARWLLRRGKLPRRLVDVAVHGDDPAWRDDPERGAERAAMVREYVDILVADALRAIRSPASETWELLSVPPEGVAAIDPGDLDAIDDMVLRLRTPEQVTEASEALQRAREAQEATS